MTIYNHKNEMRQKIIRWSKKWQSGIASAHTRKKHLHPSCKCFISNVFNQ